MKQWIVVNIGCLECGVSSAIVGAFDDELRARGVAAQCDDKYRRRQGGQNVFLVWEIPIANVIAPEYTK